MESQNKPDITRSGEAPLRITPISREEAERRRKLAAETAKKAGGKWAAPKASSGPIPPWLLTIGSFLLFVGLGQFYWGWPLAVGMAVQVFIHECGHVWAARQKGFPVTGMLFIPFLGAFVSTLRYRHDRESDAFVALMGPVFGAAGGIVSLIIAYATGQGFFLDLAIWAFGINLLNLLPIPPLDGSSIFPILNAKVRHSAGDPRGTISPVAKQRLSIAYIGLAVLLALAWYKLPDRPFFPIGQ